MCITLVIYVYITSKLGSIITFILNEKMENLEGNHKLQNRQNKEDNNFQRAKR